MENESNTFGVAEHMLDVLEKEERIFRYIFDNPVIQGIVTPFIVPEFFNDENMKKLAANVSWMVERYDQFPHPRELYAKMSESSPLRPILKRLINTPVGEKDSRAIQDECENFFRGKMLLKGLQDQIEVIQNGDTDGVRGAIDGMRDAIDFKLDLDIGVDIERDTELVITRMQEFAGAIPSSINAINEVTAGRVPGGWYRKALSIYLGQANVGKSLFMCNEAAYAYRHGYNVLFITLELAEEKITQRLYSNLCDVPYKEIEAEDTNPDTVHRHSRELQHKLKKSKIHSDDGGHIQVKFLPSGSRPADVERVIKEVQRIKDIKLDLVVVDYIGEMAPNKARAKGSRHEELGDIARQLRNLAVKYGIAVLTGSQINRDGYGTTDVSMKNVSESAQLNHVSDVMFSITQDDSLKKWSLVANKVIKNRHGPKDEIFYTKVIWDRMRARDVTADEIARAVSDGISVQASGSNFNSAA